MTHAGLFSGIGGFELAAEWAGYTNVFSCEIEPFCVEMLNKNFNHEVYGDISKQDFTAYRGKIDVVSGGFPCQDISSSGRKAGISKETRSGLFYELIRVVKEISPRYVIFENSPNVRNYPVVRRNFEENGYSLAQFNVNASQFGFIHRRERVYGVAANTARDGCSISGKIKDVADIFNEVLKKTKTSPSQLHLSNVWHTPIAKYIQYDDGLSAGVVKSEIHAFGNAIVPIIPYVFFEILKEI